MTSADLARIKQLAEAPYAEGVIDALLEAVPALVAEVERLRAENTQLKSLALERYEEAEELHVMLGDANLGRPYRIAALKAENERMRKLLESPYDRTCPICGAGAKEACRYKQHDPRIWWSGVHLQFHVHNGRLTEWERENA